MQGRDKRLVGLEHARKSILRQLDGEGKAEQTEGRAGGKGMKKRAKGNGGEIDRLGALESSLERGKRVTVSCFSRRFEEENSLAE